MVQRVSCLYRCLFFLKKKKKKAKTSLFDSGWSGNGREGMTCSKGPLVVTVNVACSLNHSTTCMSRMLVLIVLAWRLVSINIGCCGICDLYHKISSLFVWICFWCNITLTIFLKIFRTFCLLSVRSLRASSLSPVQRFVSSVGFQRQRRLQPSSRDAAESHRLQRPARPDHRPLLQHPHHQGTSTADTTYKYYKHCWHCIIRVQVLQTLLTLHHQGTSTANAASYSLMGYSVVNLIHGLTHR